MEQFYHRKKNIVKELQSCMEEYFLQGCRCLQTELERKGYTEWDKLELLLHNVVQQAQLLQEQQKKGEIQYVVFSYMNVSATFNEIEIRIDLLDKGFYLDQWECTEYYSSEILQKQYIEDVHLLYQEAEKRFIRLQIHELQELEFVYRKRYQTLCGLMLKSMADLIREAVKSSEILQSDNLQLLYGTYMDKAIKL